MPGPILWGPNSVANNLETGILQPDGSFLRYPGPKNYVGNASLENQLTTGYTLGTVGTLTNGLPTGTPTFGSGANVALSLAVVTSNQLAGLASLSLISSAATTAGNMVALDAIALDTEDQAKVLSWKFSYKVQSGVTNVNLSGTSSNSYAVAVWDATNSAWLSSAGNFNLVQGTGVGTCQGTFQTNITTASIRVCLFFPNATAGAATLNLDSFYVGPQALAFGPPASDWVAYTPTYVGFGTVASSSVFSRREGDTLYVRGFFQAGTPTAVTASMTLGYNGANANVSTDATKCASGSPVGSLTLNFSTTTAFGGSVLSTTGNTINFGYQSSTSNASNTALGNAIANTAGFVSVYFSVPITGWSSNTVMSADSNTRVVAMQVSQASPTATITGSFSLVKFTATPTQDTFSAFSTSTGLYTCPVSGFYRVTMGVAISATYTAGTSANIAIAKNGTPVVQGIQVAQASISNLYPDVTYTTYCNAGDTLSPQVACSGTTPTFQAVALDNYFAVEILTGPAVITATESVNMKYLNTAGTSIANTGDNNVPFATKVYDSHNAYNTSTGIYTCPVSGKYGVKGVINYTSATYGVNNQLICSVYKNGALDTYGDIAPVMAIVTLPFGSVVDTTIQCNAGDTLEIRAQNTRTAGATTLNTGTGFNHVEISRSGN